MYMNRFLTCVLYFIVVVVCFSFFPKRISAQSPKLYSVSPDHVKSVQKAAAKDPLIQQDIASLSKQADQLLDKRIVSVVEKKFATPCGNPHEYMSMAAYFWPDPSKPNGLPYIRKDGQRNPDNDKVTDHKGFDDLIKYVTTLSWAYYFTHNEKYAAKGTELCKFWFIDTATYMIPNLNHGQVIMGVDTGRGIGIIDIHLVPELLDAISILETSKSMNKEVAKGIHDWFDQFLVWLQTSKNGQEEFKTKNNHKTYYENLTAAIALFCGKTETAKTIFQNAKILMASQIEPDGKQPLELERTNALSYSTFHLKAWFMLSAQAENMGVDLWHYQTSDGRSIQKALDFLLPYAMDKKKFDYQQIGKYEEKDLNYLLTLAANKYAGNDYKNRALQMKQYDSPLQNLLYKY